MSNADRSLALLARMHAERASDLFLCVGKPPALRVDGRIVMLDEPATTDPELKALGSRALPPHAREEFKRSGDADIGLSLDTERRFRLNFSRQQGQLSVVARAVPSGAVTFAELELPEVLRELAESPRGLVLVTGATGSGKSTTLAAMLHHINATRDAHIVTIEDPIEFVHRDVRSRVSQREIGGDTRSFAAALRHVVRQSPDVILIGEMRDAETMQVALSAALTGHLVLATLHTIDATQTLQRILSYFSERSRGQAASDLSMSLRGIISQRLLPRADRPGRVVATEVLTAGPAVARLLREQRIEELADLMRMLASPGMMTFNRCMLGLLRREAITYETGLSYSSNPDAFALMAKGMATGSDTFRKSAKADISGFDMRALLKAALERGASDLHLTVGRPPILRISGDLVAMGTATLSEADMRMLLFSIMSGRQRSTYEIEREIDFALALGDGQRFRVNSYFQKGKMASALRAIPRDIPTAELLGIPQTVLRLGERPQGLVLVVGPTGSGKSTTLACLTDRINRSRKCRIMTIEDPVEYVHDSQMATVDQREVGDDTRSFSAALKYILRQDPDVVLVGEMRDLETISAVLTAAETGHLVLATLHSNDAAQAIDRIIDVFPSHQQGQARAQLSASLLGVISQRLLPTPEGNSRVAVFEVLIATPAIRTLVRDRKLQQVHGMMEASRREGMITLDHALKEAYEGGLISYDDALRYIKNPKMLIPPRAPGAEPIAETAPQTAPASAGQRAPRHDPPADDRGAGKRRFPWSR